MSPSLLSKRLKTLERVGIIERRKVPASQAVEYRLTTVGEELRPLIESMGMWGQRWSRGDVTARHLDATLLLWDIHRNIGVEQLPTRRVVVHFHIRGSSDKKSRYWLVLAPDVIDLCLSDPGYELDLQVEGHVRALLDYWMGRIEFGDAVRSGDLTETGARPLVRALPTWFTRSPFAPVPVPS